MWSRISGGVAVLAVLLAFGVSQAAPLPVDKIPKQIKDYVAKHYKGATISSAGTEGTDQIELFMKSSNGNFSLVFKSTANWKLIEVETPIKSLPVTVTNAVSKKFPGSMITRAERVTNAKGDLLFYTLQVKPKTGASKEVHVTTAGKFVVEP
jgi:hypothetical protein